MFQIKDVDHNMTCVL